MTIERTLETQRLTLLRLLAGLVLTVGFLSVAPIAPAWSRWVRGFVGSVLRRAEAATENLIFVQACLIAKRRDDGGRWIRFARHPAHPLTAFAPCSEAAPSLTVLRRRLARLLRRLHDLPRHGAHLLRRLKTKAMRAASAASEECALWVETRGGASEALVSANQWTVPGPWHPPD